MKNLILLFVLVFAFASLQAQNATKLPNRTTAASPAVTNGPGYHFFWGTVNDTLIASDTIVQVLRIKGDGLLQIGFQLDMTKVSGTVTNNMIVSSSVDGVTWTARDTVAYSNASTGVSLSTDPEFTNWIWPYMRVQSIAPATAQKAWYKGWLIIRY